MITLRTNWYAGEQVEALKYYLQATDVEILWDYVEDGWEGDCFAVFRMQNKFFLWRDSFGSCSGCDCLDGSTLQEGFEYIQQTLISGNTLEFTSLGATVTYLESTDVCPLWGNFPIAEFKTFVEGYNNG